MKKLILLFVFAFFVSNFVLAQLHPVVWSQPIDSCLFEQNCNILSIDSTQTNNLWEIGMPSKNPFNAAFSPPNAIVTDLDSLYSKGNHSYFDLTIDSIYDMGTLITFKHWFNTDYLKAGCYIELAVDSGIFYNVVNYPQGGFPIFVLTESFYSVTDTLSNGAAAFMGNSNTWQESKIQLVWYLPVKSQFGHTIKLRFHFLSDTNALRKPGWMIDNIRIDSQAFPGSVENLENPIKVKAFPNPFQEEINLEIDLGEKPQDLEIELRNVLGELILKENLQKVQNTRHQISNLPKDLPTGIYKIILKTKAARNQILVLKQ